MFVADSTNLANLLVLFPEIHKELDIVCKDALSKVARLDFQYSKEQVTIAEAIFNANPDLLENDRRQLVTLIKDAGSSRMLKTCLKDWETSMRGLLSQSSVKSTHVPEGQISKIVDEAIHQSRDVGGLEFFAALPGKVSKEPLLEQLTQDVVKDVHRCFREFMEGCLPGLYFRANKIKQKMMYHQVELRGREHDHVRGVSLRSDWVHGIRTAQAQTKSGCVLYCAWVYLTLLKLMP